jgi:serine/threonine-protein kinase
VKTVTGEAILDPALRAGSRKEAQAAARLTHPHITAVHDYAEFKTDDGRVIPYLVMELLHGETLADRLARGPIPWAQAAGIAGQIASALAAAHAQGVVHQDIKPANIMLTPAGVKVLDFGIAAMTGHREHTGWIIGTPAYAPPERLGQAPPDPSADVFGLGAIVCEMVTGKQPFPIHSWDEAANHRYSPPSLPASVPPQAAAMIKAALDPSPHRRPTVAALGRAIERAIEGGPPPTLTTPAAKVSAAASVPARHHTQIYEPALPLGKGTSPGLIAGVAVAVLAVLLGAVFILSGAFAPKTKDPAALSPGASSGNPATVPSATAVADTVPALLQELSDTAEAGIAAHQIDDGRARDLRNRIRDLQRLAQSQKNNRGNQFAGEIRELRARLAGWVQGREITPELQGSLDAILVRLAAAAASAR